MNNHEIAQILRKLADALEANTKQEKPKASLKKESRKLAEAGLTPAQIVRIIAERGHEADSNLRRNIERWTKSIRDKKEATA